MSVSKTKSHRRRVGDIIEIPLGDGSVALGVVLPHALYGFFDWRGPAGSQVDVGKLVSCPLLFRIWVMQYAITQGIWKVIGRISEIPSSWTAPLPSYRFDAIARKWSIYNDVTDTEVPATFDECKALERNAVWDPEHVVTRINDHYAGRTNAWVESMSAYAIAKKYGMER